MGALLVPAGKKLPAADTGKLRARNAIILNFDPTDWPAELRASVAAEAYALRVEAPRVVIHARSAAGAFAAVETLRPLLPPEIERRDCRGA